MFDKILNSTSIQIIKKMQDYVVVKQKVLANNIANVETPGFKAKDVNFQNEFSEALKKGDFASAMNLQPKVYVRNDLSIRNDGNSVDLEKEMIELQKNRMKFDIYTQLLKNRYRRVRDLFTELKT